MQKVKYQKFFFVALFFLEWTYIKARNLSFIDGLAPTMLIMLLFLLLNFDYIINIKKISKWEFVIIISLILELVLGLIFLIENKNLAGYKRFFNGYIGMVLVYLATRCCYPYFSKKEFRENMYKAMYKGCLWLTVIMGGLQLIYILTKNETVFNIINIFLWRNTTYLRNGKIQLFTEPSLFGEVFYLVFIPSYYYLYKNKIYNERKMIFSFIYVLLINMLGISTRFIIDTVVFILIFYYVKMRRGDLNKKIKYIVCILFVIFLFLIIIYFDVFDLSSKNHAIERLHLILTSNNNLVNDGSGLIRTEYLRCAWEGFKQKPIWGWGAGNYSNALRDNYNYLSNTMANTELMSAIKQNDMVSYSFIFTQLCENGIIGILNVLSVYYLLFKMIKKNNSIMLNVTAMFIMYMFIQNEMMGFISVAILLAIYNYNYINQDYLCEDYGLIKIKKEFNDENKYNNTML